MRYFTLHNPPISQQSAAHIKMSVYFTLPAISGLFPSPRNFTVKLEWFLVFPCLLLVYTVVLDWNRILGFFFFWAGSWSRQTQSRLTSSPLRFPRQFAVCVNTLFLPSSSPLPARWRPAVGLLGVGTHGDAETPTARELTSSARSLLWCFQVRLVTSNTSIRRPKVTWFLGLVLVHFHNLFLFFWCYFRAVTWIKSASRCGGSLHMKLPH